MPALELHQAGRRRKMRRSMVALRAEVLVLGRMVVPEGG